MLSKKYQPTEIEGPLYSAWEHEGAFSYGSRPNSKPYTIVIPPPNVTGSLHIGHALNTTLQDILIRFERMRGRDALWQPGTDHAGIATQLLVERQLVHEGISRPDMTRESFIKRVWKWKHHSGDTINNQLRRLGVSCDWTRERFTLDDGLSDAVRRVFVDLYKQGLIYKDKRLVNWDCILHTAISDLEVEQREVQGYLWHVSYPIEDSDNASVIITTTRPETMFGDTAIAVHPDDDRYRGLVGKVAILPLVGRRLKIIADAHANPEQGSGAVKITPAHDFNDFEVGQRHHLELINIFDRDGNLNSAVPEKYRGLSRHEARNQIIHDLESEKFIHKIEDHTHAIPYGDRSNSIIEPWLTDQWYINAAHLAQPAIEAVENGKVEFVPKHWERTYFEWMRNIQPWCISRQLWWGHQIPAWYGPDGHVFVEESANEAIAAAKLYYGKDTSLTRDEDVLDTWFSSALWPFSTLGWPKETETLSRCYPTDVLVTSFDIIFFWVARMIMMGLHFREDVPFRRVYIHALVRDESGQKMSKSKGNIIDPLELVNEYGADALRFTLAALAAQGRDIKLAEGRVQGYRNFATKLWNAARFCEMNTCSYNVNFDPVSCREAFNCWIVGEVNKVTELVTNAIESYKFNEAASAIYQFCWGTYCDWYLEFIKTPLGGSDEDAKEETRACAAWVLGEILHLLHPFMPFITEELWSGLNGKKATRLIVSKWPTVSTARAKLQMGWEIEWLIRIVTEVRAVRSELNVPVASLIPLHINDADQDTRNRLVKYDAVIKRMARVESVLFDHNILSGSAQLIVDEVTLILPLAEFIDVGEERDRLIRELGKHNAELTRIDGMLSNKEFLQKAPKYVVDEQRDRRIEKRGIRARLKTALERIAE